MNYLAHLALSGNSDQVKTGNFIADTVKGMDLSRFPDEIRKGIILHRFIDNYTDHNPVLDPVRKKMQKVFPKYYSIILDIYLDHFLALNWNNYSKTSLKAFARHVYLVLVINYKWLPPRARKSLPFLITQNWLESYKEIRGIGLIFDRMHKYRGLPWDSIPINKYLKLNYSEIEDSFNVFFNDIEEKAKEKLSSL